MMVVGIVSAAAIGIYVEKTLNYRIVFILLAILGILQTIGFVVSLKLEAGFIAFMALIVVQGVLFIPLMPLTFDYGCDILFPIG